MYVCYVCRECIESLVLDHIHLRRHEAASELTLPIQCCQEGCSGSFAKLWNLKTHLTKYYQSCQPNFNVMQFHRCEAASGVVENDVQTVETPQDDIPSAERTICDIKNEGVSLLASLRFITVC